MVLVTSSFPRDVLQVLWGSRGTFASITISAAGPSTRRREETERGIENERRKKRKELREKKTRNYHYTSSSDHKVTKLRVMINAMSSNLHTLTHSMAVFSHVTQV